MKNRPHSTRSKPHPKNFRASVKALVMSGFGLIGIGSLLLLTFFVSTDSLQQEQDVRSDASIEEGTVKISQTNTPNPSINNPHTIKLTVNTGNTSIQEVTLLFDVLTDTTGAIEIAKSNPNLEYSIEQDDVDHGFKVLMTAKSKSGDSINTLNNPMDLISINFTPNKAGPFAISYDREKSRAIVKGSNPPDDQLTHLDVFATYIEGTTPPDKYPNPEDFALLTENNKENFSFYETSGSRNEVDGDKLVKDRTYTVRYVAQVQNFNEENTLVEDPVIVNQLRINDSESVTRTFRRADLTRQAAPIDLVFETTFKAQEENDFLTTIDSTNVFLELNESNNDASVTFSNDSDAKGCNETCSSNADCKDNFACHDTGDGKRCRRSDNLSSASCQRDTSKRNLSCNANCTGNNQCTEGLTCSNGHCRNPYDTGSTSCAAPSSQILQAIKDSCDRGCTTNSGCANNMRCFNGTCRLATNPSSTSCTAATETVVTKGYIHPTPAPVATPKATATPTATTSSVVTATPIPTPIPTSTPTPTPEPTPESQPNESVLDTFFSRITNIFNNDMWSGSFFSSAMLPIAIIGAGILLLIMAIVIVLRPNKKTSYPSTSETTPPIKPELHAKPNPEPPPIPGFGVIKPQQPGGYRSGATINNPEVIEMPSSQKPAESTPTQPTQFAKPKVAIPPVPVPTPVEKPILPTQTPAPMASKPPVTQPEPSQLSDAPKPSQSMLQRLKEKGINIPDKKAGSAPKIEASTTGDSQPPTAGWPEDSQK